MSTLSNESAGGIDYITIFDGRLVQRVMEGTEGAISRELQKGDNAGKTVWEKTYSSVSGKITGGGIVVKEFGAKKVKEIHVKLDDDLLLPSLHCDLAELADDPTAKAREQALCMR